MSDVTRGVLTYLLLGCIIGALLGVGAITGIGACLACKNSKAIRALEVQQDKHTQQLIQHGNRLDYQEGQQ